MIHLGDCLDVLKGMAADSIDSMVCDPPAGINFMSKKWDKSEGFIPFMRDAMKECLRVLKPGAHAFVWAIPRTSHWTATALEEAGWEIRDVVTHIFGSGFPKSMNISIAMDKQAGVMSARGRALVSAGKGDREDLQENKGNKGAPEHQGITPAAAAWQGWGTALKPASEHWILCRKPLSEKTIAANVIKHGTGGINIDKSRIPANKEAWVNEENLCDSCVKRVANNARQSTQETKESIAAEHADIKDSEKTLGILPDVISIEAIGCSDETSKANTSTSLNMSTCGKSTQEKENKEASFSTTSTRTDPTTGLKTCSMCAQPLTSNTTRITGQGRFPSNLLLSHNPDCVEMGVKKVKTSTLLKTHNLSESENNALSGKNYARNPKQDYGADGTETVPAWECTEGCTVAELDRQSGVSKSQGGGKKAGVRYGAIMGKVSDKDIGDEGYYGDSGGASRFFYCAKASKRERNEGCEGLPEKEKPGVFDDDNYEWKHDHVRAKPSANHHPTIKPIRLMQYLITMVTPPGGTCMDPFMGSGSTGVAAIKSGFNFIGIEKEPEYFAIAEKRINHALVEEQ